MKDGLCEATRKLALQSRHKERSKFSHLYRGPAVATEQVSERCREMQRFCLKVGRLNGWWITVVSECWKPKLSFCVGCFMCFRSNRCIVDDFLTSLGHELCRMSMLKLYKGWDWVRGITFIRWRNLKNASKDWRFGFLVEIRARSWDLHEWQEVHHWVEWRVNRIWALRREYSIHLVTHSKLDIAQSNYQVLAARRAQDGGGSASIARWAHGHRCVPSPLLMQFALGVQHEFCVKPQHLSRILKIMVLCQFRLISTPRWWRQSIWAEFL